MMTMMTTTKDVIRSVYTNPPQTHPPSGYPTPLPTISKRNDDVDSENPRGGISIRNDDDAMSSLSIASSSSSCSLLGTQKMRQAKARMSNRRRRRKKKETAKEGRKGKTRPTYTFKCVGGGQSPTSERGGNGDTHPVWGGSSGRRRRRSRKISSWRSMT